MEPMKMPLDDAEVMNFKFLHDSDTNVALVRSVLDGEPVAVLAAVEEDDGTISVFPLAVLLTERMLQRLQAPEEAEDIHVT